MYDRFRFIEQRFLIISSLSDQYGGLILLVLTDNTTHEQVLGEVRAQSHGLNERGGPLVPVLRSDFRCMKRLGGWSTTASWDNNRSLPYPCCFAGREFLHLYNCL